MRFVVTGGAGFIGSHLVESLLANGHEVVVLDDFSTGKRENIDALDGRIEVVEGSVTDLHLCTRVATGADFVLHQAAIPSVPRSIDDPVSTHEASATGTLNVLIASREAGVRRVIYAGSSSAYGDTPTLPKEESMPPRPRSPYAVGKLAGELYCQAFSATYGLETITLRYFNVFGPRQDPDSPYGAVIPKFIDAALADNSPVIFGDGEQTRDFTYVGNVVRANLLACEAGPEAVGRVFNVGCGSRVSVNELWERIRRLTATEREPTRKRGRAGDVRDSLACLRLARDLLGYEPLTDLNKGLRLTVEHLASAPTH